MNHSLPSADQATHIKIVSIALVAAILVVVVGIAARIAAPPNTDGTAAGSRVVAKAEKAAVYTPAVR